MIRVRDLDGRIVLGLTRQEVKGLLEGKLCCFPAGKPTPDAPHICIYFGETDADVLGKIREAYEAARMPLGETRDFRTRPNRGDN